MRKLLFLLPLAAVVACHQKPIYENDSYSMYADRIVQGEFTGVAESPYRIVSNLDGEEYVWEKKNDFSSYPSLQTPYLIEEAAFNIGLDESINAVEPDGTLRTGLEWGGVWTRDVSYSIIHSMSYIQTEASKTSLMCKVDPRGMIIQDTGTGGAWPCSTDREIWVGAAWEIYKVTGDMDWLKTVYPIAKRSLEVDMRTVFEKETNLVRGESSFIDWREQSYPTWMEPADIYDSKCLGTNMAFYIALSSTAQMGRILGDDASAQYFDEMAALVKKGINDNLWMEDCGYYAQYIAGRSQDLLYTKSETLGEALAILWDVAEGERAERLSQSLPVVDFGAPVFWPWIPDQPPYHNRAVWPWVQAYWIQACAKTGNEPGVLHGIGSVWRAALMYATNKENFVADTGNWRGTQINSSNMLWCLAGNLSITFKLLMGMNFGADELYFAPVVPRNLGAERTVRNFRYRNATLDITVSGFGDSIKVFRLDGVEMEEAKLPGNIEGHHTVEIVMSDTFRKEMTINHKPACWTPEMPRSVGYWDGWLSWHSVNNAHHYEVYVGGEKKVETQQRGLSLEPEWKGDIQVVAVAADGTPSLPSEPHNNADKVCKKFPETMLTKKSGKEFRITVDVPEAGEWALCWYYANGTGPVTTDNNCGVRMLYVNGAKSGINVFPHRGEDDWDDWGWTIPEKLSLVKGQNTFVLKCEPDADNMDIYINDFKIKELRLIRL